MRLHAQESNNIVENARGSFVAPTAVDQWAFYVRRIAANHTHGHPMGDRLLRNIAHRFQLLEFETALLLHHKETTAIPDRATLHETVLHLKIHQHVVLCHAIFEGISSHIVRFNATRNGHQVDPQRMVAAPTWRAALRQTAFPDLGRVEKRRLIGELEKLTHWRDLIHLDRFNAQAPLHFNVLTVDGCFIPAHRMFRRVMTALNAAWPAATPLNEDIPAPP